MNKVAIGATTKASWIVSVIAGLPAVLNQIISYVENNQAHFSGSEKTMAIIAAAVFGISALLRYVQALLPASVPTEAAVADELAPGTSPKWVPAAVPQDGVDSAQVARSGS